VKHLLLAWVLLLHPLMLGALPAHAQDDAGYYDGSYADGGYDQAAVAGDEVPDLRALDPYGSWMDDATYGRVWEPSVRVGWAPYVDGYWTWTPAGWTWGSFEPWAWTFHYGRWVLLPVGWVWVPGSVWGPAWVDWFWGDGFVGWAPLSPFGVTVINQFVFVHDRDFCSRNLARLVVDHHLVPNDVVHRWQHRDPMHERPPGLHHVERVSARPVTHLDRRPPGTIAPQRPGRAQLARPNVTPELGAARTTEARLGYPWRLGSTPVAARPSLDAAPAPRPSPVRIARPAVPSPFGARPPLRGADVPPIRRVPVAPPVVAGARLGMPVPRVPGAVAALHGGPGLARGVGRLPGAGGGLHGPTASGAIAR
jgi:hypothetical protein